MRKLLLAVLVLVGMLSAVSSVEGSVVTTYDPSMAVFTPSADYAYMTGNWQDFLSLNNWHGLGGTSHAYFRWNVDLATVGAIESATFKIQKNNEGSQYGIPAGTHLEFALVTQDWSLTAGQNMTPPVYWAYGPTNGTPITVTAPAGITFEADITTLMQTWQASPSSYYGILIRATDSGGGVIDPGNGGITGDMVLTTVPEPATLSLLALGGLALRRRRK